MECRTCGNEMEKINGPGLDSPEYSCENCHDYRNANGEWRSFEEGWTPMGNENIEVKQ
jgi:hypothetical protein